MKKHNLLSKYAANVVRLFSEGRIDYHDAIRVLKGGKIPKELPSEIDRVISMHREGKISFQDAADFIKNKLK